ncbi:hypothetical protein BDZ89DRAFT_7982 [Hymenopellis radicata]|nr:hypothetical protein BDZ89DRAFT_7982 [Hymenopellis radicata]
MMKTRYRTKSVLFPPVDLSQPLRKQRITGALSYPVPPFTNEFLCRSPEFRTTKQSFASRAVSSAKRLVNDASRAFPSVSRGTATSKTAPGPTTTVPRANLPNSSTTGSPRTSKWTSTCTAATGACSVTAPAQQRQQQNIQAAPPSQEQWLQRMRGQEAEPRNGAVRATVLSLIEQRDVINAQLKGLYETFGREGR